MEQRAVVRLLTLKDLKAQEIERKQTSVDRSESLRISAAKKWPTNFLQGRRELGDHPRSGCPPILI
jgi:hypothetical protein